MIYVFHATLAAALFLFTLNGFLKGSRKARIHTILGLAVCGLWSIGFVTFGWRAGSLAIVLTPIYVRIARPRAAAVAVWIFSRMYRDDDSPPAMFRGLPDPVLLRISRRLGRPRDPRTSTFDVVTGNVPDGSSGLEDLLAYCATKPEVREAMLSLEIDPADLLDLYSSLMFAGAGQWAVGHWVAASALAYPDPLRFVARRLRRNDATDRYAAQKVALALLDYFERGAPLPES